MKYNKVVNCITLKHQKSVRREEKSGVEKSREVKKEELSRPELNKISYK